MPVGALLIGWLALCFGVIFPLPQGWAAVSGPAVLEAMLKEIGPARSIQVQQRVESVVTEPVSLPDEAGATAVGLPEAAASQAAASHATASQGTAFEKALSGSGHASKSDPFPGTTPLAEVEHPLPPVLTEALIFQLPGGFRAEIQSDAIQRLYLEVGGTALLVIDGQQEPLGSGWFERYKDLFLFNRRLALHRHLALIGVDLAVTSLGLWEARPVYVLGARFPDTAAAQIWVDKESLLPLRWLWQMPLDGGGDGSLAGPAGGPLAARQFEIRYDRWQLFGKRRYPLRVAFYENHALVRTLIAERIVVDQEVDASLMDIEAVRQTTLPSEADLPQAETTEDPAVEEIQEAIDIFKKRYE